MKGVEFGLEKIIKVLVLAFAGWVGYKAASLTPPISISKKQKNQNNETSEETES